MNTIHQRLDLEAVRIMALTRRLCAETGLARVYPEMYAVTILTSNPNTATRAVESLGGNVSALLSACRQAMQARSANLSMSPGNYFSFEVDESCKLMANAAEEYRAFATAPRIGILHVLLGVLKTSSEVAAIFDDAGVGLQTLQGLDRRPATPNHPGESPGNRTKTDPIHQREEAPSYSSNPLAAFCIDLTAMATAGQLDPVIGREREIDRVITTLCRKKKANPLLVGDPGVGKSCIVEALAQRLVSGNVPAQIKGRRIYAVDLARLVAGTQFRGQFEERLKALLDAARQQRDCILFIDEAHAIIGAGSALGTLDAANIMKPALARGDLCCIGATTDAEYQKYFRKDKALDRRFQRIPVDEPSPTDTIAILPGSRVALEQYHGCTITDDAIAAAVELSGRHVTDRYYPDKAIDVLDEMCARFAVAGKPLGRTHVAQTVADQIGAPLETVQPTEDHREEAVERELRRLVVGQEPAIKAVTRAVGRVFSPVRDPLRPLASFVFGGPSGVGKSYTARIIGRQLYSLAPLIRLNMSEYAEKHNVSRLIGAPPGYIGFGERNQLTDRVMRHPHSVVLFDNIDKAHPEVMQSIMEMLDVGVLTDGEGNEVNFRGTFIIMTTTVGSDERVSGAVGFGSSTMGPERSRARDRLMAACRDLFGDEFVNRVDDFVPFFSLGHAELRHVAAFMIEEVRQRLASSGVTLRCDAQVLDHLARSAANARAVRAAVKNEIEPLVCSALARGGAKTIHVSLKHGCYSVT